MMLSDLFNLGTIGAGIFFFSWLYQAWETKRQGQSVVSATFWILRLIGVLILVVYSIQINSLIFAATYLITGIVTIYNIYMAAKPKGKTFKQPPPLEI